MVASGERCARATHQCFAIVTNQTKIVRFEVDSSIGWVKNATTRGRNDMLSSNKEKRTDALRMVTRGDRLPRATPFRSATRENHTRTVCMTAVCGLITNV